MNGFGAQGRPARGRPEPGHVPVQVVRRRGDVRRQRSGAREFDINKDGVAHYGLYPDWVEDLRKIAGDQIVEDMSRGAEAYLQMWERAVGVPRDALPHAEGRLQGRAASAAAPRARPAAAAAAARASRCARTRAWTWCVRGKRNRKAKVVAVFTRRGKVGLVASTARLHTGPGIGRGARASRLRGHEARSGSRLRVRRVRRAAARSSSTASGAAACASWPSPRAPVARKRRSCGRT